MKIGVIGCGGVGGVIAANLIRQGNDVTIATGSDKIAAAIRDSGMHVTDANGLSWTVQSPRQPVIALGENDGPFDILIMTTQATMMEAALQKALPTLSKNGVVVTCQNGLPEDRAAKIIGAARVLGCVVGWAASMPKPGVYTRTSSGGFALGRVTPEGPSPGAVAEVLRGVARVRIAENFAGSRWSKLAINCVTTTMGAVGGARVGELLLHHPVRRLAIEVFSEVNLVAQKIGVKLEPIAGTLDINRVSIAPWERTLGMLCPTLPLKHAVLLAAGLRFRRLRSSMLYAIEKGRPPEIDFLNGEVVARGEQLGVPTPANRALVEAVHAIVRGERKSSLAFLEEVGSRVP